MGQTYECTNCGKKLDCNDIVTDIVDHGSGQKLDIMIECECGMRAFTFVNIEDLTIDIEE